MNNNNKTIINNFGFQWLIVFIICMIVRLPYFLGSHCYFDGDEAIVGIMAQDLLQGKNIPVYFYGQQYGFAFFEVVGVAFGVLLFGSGLWALKFGSLLIFSIGCTFLFRMFLKKGMNLFWALMAILIVAMFPSWIVWACKARGGYVTAFSLACIILYITQLKKPDLTWSLIAAFIMALLIHSQIFIAFTVSFLLLNWVLKTKNKKIILLTTLLFVSFYFLTKLPAFLNGNYWELPFSYNFHYKWIMRFLLETPKVFMGYFYYEMTFPMRMRTLLFGAFYFVILVIILGSSFINGRKELRLNIVLIILGGAASFLCIMFMKIPSYRYFLGFETAILFAIILGFLELFKMERKGKYYLILLLPFSIAISFTSKNIKDSWMLPELNDMKLYTEFTKELNKREIKNVFCTDPLLQWMLNYNGFNARYISKTERTNYFLDEVDKCYENVDCKTGIVGYKGMCLTMDQIEGWHDQVVYINDKFFIFENPQRSYLDKGGFEFTR